MSDVQEQELNAGVSPLRRAVELHGYGRDDASFALSNEDASPALPNEDPFLALPNEDAFLATPNIAGEKFTMTERLVGEELAAATGDVCVTNSFQAEDMIVLHMVRQTRPDVPVVFLDTGYHFAEVYDYRDRMAKAWGMNLTNLLPELTVPEQEAQFGILNQTEPNRCCGMRKVTPLFAELERYGLWFTGLRREQAKSRAALQPIEDFGLPTGRTIRKISPLTEWTAKDVWQYAALHEIPLISLYDKGYSSIGCEPCTSRPADPNDPRSGRWGGQKQECGIHVQGS